MKNRIDNNSSAMSVLDEYNNNYSSCFTNPHNINHLTQWVCNELLINIAKKTGLSSDELNEFTPATTNIAEDWSFAKTSYEDLLLSNSYDISNSDDILSFVEDWNDILQEYRFNRNKNVIKKCIERCLTEEECDVSNEHSLFDFFYLVTNRVLSEVTVNQN